MLPHVYLTFEEENTSTSITINFMALGVGEKSSAYFDEVSRQGIVKDYQNTVEGRVEYIKGVDKTYHHVKLNNLKPNTTYYFAVGDEKIGFSPEFQFKTLPEDDSEIRLLIGGDMSASSKIIETAESAMSNEPHAIVVGGDIAYANGKVSNEKSWMAWFEKMDNIMFTPTGRLVPLVFAIGNHETSIGSALPGNKVPFFFTLFPQNAERSSYFVKTFGAHTVLLILDSGHVVTHKKQETFVKEQMQRFANKKFKIAAYHAPLYPNYREYSGTWAANGRKYWMKYFDQYNLDAAFEHHDHSLKRTKILRGDKVTEKGTVYFGDGCWGKTGRGANPEKWYLEKATADTHVWYTVIGKESMTMKALGKDGEVYDHVKLTQTPEKTFVEDLL